MKTIKIEIDGKEYPMRVTMGAMSIFEKETGRDVSEMSGSVLDTCVFVYGCVKSACRKDGVDFPYTLDDFLDSCDVETVTEWGSALDAASPANDTKKKEGQPSTVSSTDSE